jgi:hypothetical protein
MYPTVAYDMIICPCVKVEDCLEPVFFDEPLRASSVFDKAAVVNRNAGCVSLFHHLSTVTIPCCDS